MLILSQPKAEYSVANDILEVLNGLYYARERAQKAQQSEGRLKQLAGFARRFLPTRSDASHTETLEKRIVTPEAYTPHVKSVEAVNDHTFLFTCSGPKASMELAHDLGYLSEKPNDTTRAEVSCICGDGAHDNAITVSLQDNKVTYSAGNRPESIRYIDLMLAANRRVMSFKRALREGKDEEEAVNAGGRDRAKIETALLVLDALMSRAGQIMEAQNTPQLEDGRKR